MQRKTAKRKAFLAAYKKCGTITHAAIAAGVERNTHYVWLTDPAYAAVFAEAQTAAVDLLVTEARRRAVEGVEEPVYHQGQVVGTIQKYSDVLLIFLLKGALPDVYRERYDFRGELHAKMIEDPGREKLTDETIDRLILIAERVTRTQGD